MLRLTSLSMETMFSVWYAPFWEIKGLFPSKTHPTEEHQWIPSECSVDHAKRKEWEFALCIGSRERNKTFVLSLSGLSVIQCCQIKKLIPSSATSFFVVASSTQWKDASLKAWLKYLDSFICACNVTITFSLIRYLFIHLIKIVYHCSDINGSLWYSFCLPIHNISFVNQQ